MALSFMQWVGSVIAEQVVAAPDPRLAALEQKIMDLTAANARLTAAVDAALAGFTTDTQKVADLAAANARLQAQLDAQASTVSAEADRLTAGTPAPEPAPTDPNAPAPTDPSTQNPS